MENEKLYLEKIKLLDAKLKAAEKRIAELEKFSNLPEPRELENREQQIIDSEDRFRKYIEYAPDGVFIVDNKGKYVEVNPAACKITGYNEAELLTKTTTDLIPESDHEKAFDHFKQVQEKGFAVAEVAYMKKGGEKRFWVVSAVKLSDTRYLGFAKDTTDRILTAQQLKQSEEKYRTLAESSPLVILTHKADGSITYINKSGADILGLPAEKLIGGNTTGLLNNEQKASYYEELNKLIHQKTTLHKSEMTFDQGHEIKFLETRGILLSKNDPEPEILVQAMDITDKRKAEIELRKSQEILLKTQSIAHIGSWELNLENNELTWSDEVYRIFGAKPDDFVATYEAFLSYVHPDDRNLVDEAYRNSINNHVDTYEIKHRIQRKDGEIRYVHEKCVHEKNDQGEIIKSIGMVQDITEQKTAEKNLRDREAKYRALFENAPIMHGIINNRGNYEDVNEAVYKMLGHTKEELLGKNAFDLIHKDDRQRVMDAFTTTIKTGDGEVDYRFRHKNGHYRLMSSKASEIPGTKTYFIHSEDITERKLAEENLRQSEARFRSTVSDLLAGIVVHDSETNILYSNAEAQRILGLTDEELKDKSAINSDWHFVDETNKRLLPDQYPVMIVKNTQQPLKNYVLGVKHTAGTPAVWINVNATPVNEDSGKIKNIVVNFTDITELKNTEAQLIEARKKAEESDRLKSAFLANMSHEIRTPMNGILGFAELLKDDELSNTDKRRFIAIIEKSGERMLNIINDLIDISKIEAGQIKVSISETNITEQINYLGTFFRPEAERKGLQLKGHMPETAQNVIIKTDREKVYAVLTNLLKNALKYTHSGSIEYGHQSVVLPDKRKGVKMWVKDTGIGIAKNRQKAIFDRFVQEDIEDKKALEGAGLGLAISSAYAGMLEGAIEIESEQGVGSTFTFTIPDLDTPATEEPVEKQDETDQGKSDIQKRKILIAEDDEFSLLHLKTLVRKMASEILTASTGADAVQTCKNQSDIDLILMDIKLPGMNGYEATHEIRKFNKEVIIIAQTAYALSGDREKALEAGCNDYLSKPIKKSELMRIVSSFTINKQ